MPTLRNIAAFGLLLVLIPCAATADPADLEPLRFLSGAWGADGEIVELWLPPLRGLMVGINRSSEGDGMPFFEYLRIEARADGVYYIASPKGEGTTEFELTEVSASRAVFENPEHDFPQKIIYQRTGDALGAEVGAYRDGAWRSFKLNWSAVACPQAEGECSASE